MEQVISFLNSRNVILASSSRRRKQIFKIIGINYKTFIPNISENLNKNIEIKKLPLYFAKEKAKKVAINNKEKIVIAADTIVLLEGKILTKPKNRTEAIEMLSILSGRKHKVMTGVAVSYLNKFIFSFIEKTDVYFDCISKSDMRKYIDEKFPFDKAGGYGIQDIFGMCYVKKISGDYWNVVGFPVNKFMRYCSNFLNSHGS
ncbi:MAG: Maf family protein [Spirochaetia bacterium]|nr:Maf family protein [Spirochaetia bacterium]